MKKMIVNLFYLVAFIALLPAIVVKAIIKKLIKLGDENPKLCELLLTIIVLIVIFSIFIILGRIEYIAIETMQI